MNQKVPNYRVYSLRFASVSRQRRENFIATDFHDAPMPLDYYVWVIQGEDRTWLVDTGFDEAAARARKRELLQCPIIALSELNLAASDITDVIITHLHYDHAGNIGKLPGARFHIQEQELQFATGRHMCHDVLRHPYTVDDVNELVRSVYRKRVHFYNGDAELAPGLQLVLVGGHTAGLQAVRVHTSRGWMVLASDAIHFYENAALQSPYPLVFNVADMLAGHQRLLSLADSFDHLIPGHDPLVHSRYKPARPGAVFARSLHEPAVVALQLHYPNPR